MIRTYYILVFFSLLSLLIPMPAIGQTTLFTTYENTSGDIGVASTINLPEGILLTGGSIMDSINGDEDLLLVKSDTVGNLVWAKTAGNINKNTLVAMSNAGTNSIAILASDSIAGLRYYSFLLLDSSGICTLQKTFSVPGMPDIRLTRILSHSSGNFIVSGTSNEKIILFSLSELGSVNWTKSFSTTIPGATIGTIDLTEMSIGHLALIADISGEGKIALLLMNSIGNILSSEVFSEANNLRIGKIYYSASSGDLFIGGTKGNRSLLLMRLDSEGNVYWITSHETPLLNSGRILDMVFDPSSDAFAVLANSITSGFEVLRFNSYATMMWSTKSSNYNEIPKSILADPSGSFFVTGTTPSTISQFQNMFLARVMADGLLCDNIINHTPKLASAEVSVSIEAFTINPTFQLIDTLSSYSMENFSLTKFEKCRQSAQLISPENVFTLHSNIVSNELHLRTGEPYDRNDLINIIDLRGRIVSKQQPSTGYYELTLDVSKLSQGHYFVTIYKNGHLTRKRFVIQR